ncbi:MAG: response regulator [Gammaproteobacteria bacterium]|jgi:CheY-like chemotaxis protein
MEGSKKCILIVEDSKLAQTMAVAALEDLNCEIYTADTGTEAITRFKARSFDLVFMDLGLPDIDGYNVTKTLRELEEKSKTHTPIIALTAHTEDEFKKNAKKFGMDDFLAKPLTKDKVKDMLDKYVQSEHTSKITHNTP